jgi:PAS domain S-box-containing protein
MHSKLAQSTMMTVKEVMESQDIRLTDVLSRDLSMKALVRSDHVGEVVFASESLKRMFGYDGVYIHNQTIQDIIQLEHEHRERFEKVLQISRDIEQKSAFTQTIQTKDGDSPTFTVCISPISGFASRADFLLVLFEQHSSTDAGPSFLEHFATARSLPASLANRLNHHRHADPCDQPCHASLNCASGDPDDVLLFRSSLRKPMGSSPRPPAFCAAHRNAAETPRRYANESQGSSEIAGDQLAGLAAHSEQPEERGGTPSRRPSRRTRAARSKSPAETSGRRRAEGSGPVDAVDRARTGRRGRSPRLRAP